MSGLIITSAFSVNDQRIIRRALRLLEKYQRQPGEQFLAASYTKTWLQLHLARQEREVFVVLYLDNQHRLLEHETLFLGTINHIEVHPREIMKSALRHNAAAVILAHNHPSGITDASKADRIITDRIVNALNLVEVRVLDHFIIGDCDTLSFAEMGWL
ncbi:DNA repair protein RadC [Enterobacter bugandensis]|uniref:RadC family protein n=1 Tax=Enterobacter bugandensis TaxID=881260 RepID=UPI0037542B64